MEKLKARATKARNILLRGLYAAANDSRSSPASRAKAFDTWERLTREEEVKDLNIIINIQGEKDERE
jgi:hypothetical protein